MEGQYKRKTGTLLSFSDQQLVDCDTENFGCDGGWMESAYESAIRMGGFELEADYPYTSSDGVENPTCLTQADHQKFNLQGAVYFGENDELGMQKWMEMNGPISVAIDATPMQFYKKGIIGGLLCGKSLSFLNHAVLLYGYGYDTGLLGQKKPYWFAKNQWGTDWGEKGYFRIRRGNNACGIATLANAAVV